MKSPMCITLWIKKVTHAEELPFCEMVKNCCKSSDNVLKEKLSTLSNSPDFAEKLPFFKLNIRVKLCPAMVLAYFHNIPLYAFPIYIL